MEEESERATDDEGFWRFAVDDIEETEGEASEEVFERDIVENEVLKCVDVVSFDECLGGGEVFPFLSLVFVGIFDVSWLESVGGFCEKFAVLSDAAADAGGKSEVDGLAGFSAEAGGLVECCKIGVVGEENFAVE